MATRPSKSSKSSEARELTLTERARRSQLIEVTVELVADRGYADASLAGIAERAGITKAAVLYHFESKAALVRAAHEHVLAQLVAHVVAAIEAADADQAPAAYIRAMIGHLREHPRHTRMITEAMTNGEGVYDPAERWRPLADLLGAATRAVETKTDLERRTLAIIIGGAIDAIVSEQLADPDYDTAAAADQLVDLVYADRPA
ncbi:TetR/AcrR family transcriptional regulator [Glycomyces sp. TRM65418]|uniref:TetR/AcrR family transcriptional regulator n=1 Tax=Glycomyces sp. TRM65418 TaxID=2867006 RepID=UPI001CE500A6|nr:TetR/AcrR family transcriptional regulator [Glycomyces sp. TRM65418]MCC3765932.1 TetR/AcrR family transcriptional regulator [Glycomyces sp. TRM65418]QZD55514.1 TetR/AcrR family transcriptional regulator [Glycomyces sp. TRM65418]